MSIRVGINGFGRIGRSVFRVLLERQDMEVVAINDLFSAEALAHLLQYDTVMGRLDAEVTCDAGALYVGGKKVILTAKKDPGAIDWKGLKVDVVVEATGIFAGRADLEKHLSAGARKVLLTVPPKDEIDNMVVLGVNDASLKPEHRLVSNASCTTNCLAPLAKVLDGAFGIVSGLMTTVHAYTNDQRLVDWQHKDLRRSRAAAENIIPTTTGAARAVGKVLPHLKGKLDGMATRVPVSDGSIIDLVLQLQQKVDRDAINRVVREAAAGPLKGILAYSALPLVSTDILGNPHSSVFDAPLTQAQGDGWARVVSWYDNEWGYSNRCADLIGRMGQHL